MVRRDPETVALTSPINATGVFDLDPQAEMLLPFEGSGVDGSWEFQLPKAANQFDYRTIADVLLTIEYTALNSFDYRQQVIQRLDPRIERRPPVQLPRPLPRRLVRAEQPGAVARSDDRTVRDRRGDFPPNVAEGSLRIDQLLLYVKQRAGAAEAILVRTGVRCSRRAADRPCRRAARPPGPPTPG